MAKASKSETQARLRKEEAERDAKMAKQKADRLAANSRLKDIGREIEVRVGKLDQLGGKTVDMVDSIDHLLADAEKLCDPAGFTFAAFKKTYCPKLGQSRTYELFAIRDGRKSLEEIRADTRKRVAKHREAKRVTEKDSVTEAAEGEATTKPAGTPEPTTAPATGSADTEIDTDARKARNAELAGETPAAPVDADASNDETGPSSRPGEDDAGADDLSIPPFIRRTAGEAPPAEPPSTVLDRLNHHINELWSLCQEDGLSGRELRTAMKKRISELRKLLAMLATPKSAKLH